MPPRRRKKLKVAVRRSRVAYQWRSFAETVSRWIKAGVFVSSAAGLAWGAQWVWGKTALLTITEVTVEGPALPGWAEDPPLKRGQPLFSFSAGRVERRLLERYPQLESVRVRRQWDRAVRFCLVPRQAVAKVPFDGGGKAMDRTGAVFPLEGGGADLPLLILPSPARATGPALAFLSALRASKESWTDGLHKITISSDGEAVLLLRGDWPVYWGRAEADIPLVARKAQRLQRVLSAPESVGGIEYARFVDDRRVVIKPRVELAQRKESHG